jgi:hypothetical protein
MGKSESTGFNKIIFFWFLKLPGVVILQLTIASNFYYFVLLAQTFFYQRGPVSNGGGSSF